MHPRRECPVCHSAYSGGEGYCATDGAALLDLDGPGGPAGKAGHGGALALMKDPRIGQVIGGRFTLVERLAQGGMGVVYRAVHQVLDRPFAIKLLRPDLLSDEQAARRFRREARAASALSHPHIINIYDYGHTDKGEPYLAMEYAHGPSLFQVLSGTPDHALPLPQAVDIALQIARALRHAHGLSVVHRDIKPENVLLVEAEEHLDFVKVLDFGLARILGWQPLTRVGDDLLGTPEFMAPEIFSGDHQIGSAVDIYALGALFYELCVGQPPFTGTIRQVMNGHLSAVPEPLGQRHPDHRVLPDLEQIVQAMLDKAPARRPAAHEVVAQLERLRPWLPRRSARSLMLMKTYILSEEERGLSLRTAETYLFAQNPLHEMTTRILPRILQEVDQVEEELSEHSERLGRQARALMRLRFPEVPVRDDTLPAEAARLRLHLSDREQEEEDRSLRLALAEEQIAQKRQAAQEQREALHQQILALGDELYDQLPNAPAVRAERETERIRLEAAYAALAQDGQEAREAAALRGELHELRGEIRHARRQLAQVLLEACRAEAGAPDARLELSGSFSELSRLCDLHDGSSAALAHLLQRLPAGVVK